jgi:uncharacterized phage protein gp47/JayE
MHAGAVHCLYGFLDWIAKQGFPDTAEAENMERWATLYSIVRKASTKATGTVTLTGTNGMLVNTGTVLQRGDGVEFVTTQAVTIASGTAIPTVEAKKAGEDGNTTTATILTFVSPIAGVNATATSGTLAGGTDSESDDSLRERLLIRMRQPPQGGAEFDYKAWALECAGVTRAFVVAQEAGVGTVTVRPMMDDTYANGIPQAGDIETIQSYIHSKRPVTAAVTVVAPTPTTLNFNITLKKKDGATENSPTVRAAVEAELKDLITRDAEPGGKILLSRMREAISIAAGEYDHVLNSPAADVTQATGQIAVFGAITWV